ncbi:hypothetical protein [Flavobacterium sp.]|uniref:hypothetical protein n=1 Tax=Flavobacterium sp. TaxID=239 RepID=UPI003B9C7819
MATDATNIEKVYMYQNFRESQSSNIAEDDYSYKSISSSNHPSLIDWQSIKKTTWIKSAAEEKIAQDYILSVNDEVDLKIPIVNKELENIFIEGKYILDLKDNWDDEGAVGYTIESWKAAANFIISFNRWLRGIFSGSLHLPKMHHGPSGTIDVIWNEDNFRLFVNIDFKNNTGTFYSDSPKKQFSEGEFLLNDLKFQLLPLPFKY